MGWVKKELSNPMYTTDTKWSTEQSDPTNGCPWQEASRSCNVDVEPLPVTLGHNQGKSGLLLVPLSPSPTQAAAPLGRSTRCSHSPLLFFWPHFPSVAKIICIYTTKLPAVHSRGKKKKKKKKRKCYED